MKSRIFIFAIAVLTVYAIFAFAQPPDTLWTRTYGGYHLDEGRSVHQTADGGYIVGGYTYSWGAGSWDLYLVKTDSIGDTLWTSVVCGGSGPDWCYCVQQTNDEGYIMAGETMSYGAGSTDYYLVKTDNIGDTLWTRTYGGSLWDLGQYVQQTIDGGYIVAGYTNSFGAGADDIYLVKTDSNGDTLWTRTYGGVYQEWCHCVQQTTDGGYVLGGITWSFGPGDGDYYLVKTNSFGDTLWTQTYGGQGVDHCKYVQQTTDGGYILGGYTNSYGAGGYDFYMIKTNSTGDTLWTRTYGGSGADWGQSVQQTTDEGYILGGYTNSYGAGGQDFYLVKTNSTGDTLWTRTYGGSGTDNGYSVQQTTDGGYIFAGFTESYGAGWSDVYLVKADVQGNQEWTQTFGGSDYEYGRGVQQTSEGGYIIAGSTISFGAGFADVYLIRLEGEEPSEVSIILTPENPPIQIPAGGGSFNFGLEIDNGTINNYTIDVATNVTLPGGTIYPILTRYNINLASGATITRNLTQFVPAGAPSGNYTYNGYVYDHTTWEILADDSFPFEKLAGDGLPTHNLGWALIGWDDAVETVSKTVGKFDMLTPYPNPFNPTTTISFEIRDAGFVNLTIYDITGREVSILTDGYKPAGEFQVVFDASELSSGIYFAKLTAGEFTQTQKLLLIK